MLQSLPFLIGLGIGLIITLPTGAVNIMVIQRSFNSGFMPGFTAGLGSVAADTLFAAIAAFGVVVVSDFIARNAASIEFLGGMVLVGFGVRVFLSRPHLEPGGDRSAIGLTAGFMAAFVMTITNPGAVLGFITIFGNLGSLAPRPGDYFGAFLLVAGVAVGATAWWFCLAGGIATMRRDITDRTLRRINRFAGSILAIAGVALLGLAVSRWL